MKWIIDCEYGKHLCDKNQYNETTFWERVSLNIHLIFCPSCMTYTKGNNKLSKSIKKAHIKTMPQDAKAALQERISKELSK